MLEPSEVSASLARMDHIEPLDPLARDLLDFEGGSWKLTIAKERAIRERFGLSPTRYYQLLNRVVDLPAALGYDPMLVRRLRRIRASRRRKRVLDQLGLRL